MAASGTAVTVLTPNGRRQTVKVSPNTPLLQVLEDVCKKHGFNPDDHGLKFQRTTVDLTLPWRFANLPNNAKLEMVTSTRKQAAAESQVRIALQMEDGSRLQGSFSSGQSLWELLTHFPEIRASELTESGSTPVCVYMRDEVSGEEALKKASLKSLGLTGGSAIVRFLLKKTRQPEEEEFPDATQTTQMPTTFVAKEMAPSPASHPAVTQPHQEMSATEVPAENSVPDRPVEVDPVPTHAPATTTVPVKQEEVKNSHDAVRPKETRVSEEDGETAGPSGLNCHSSSSSSASFVAPSAPFIPFSGGGQRLGGPGGSVGGRSLSSSSSSSSLSVLSAAGESPKAKKAKSSHGSSAKGVTATKQPEEEMEQGETFLEPVEREPLIYHLDTVSHDSKAHQDLPDEFFEVTVDDIRKRFAQLKSERKMLEEAPLMTKSLREAQMREKMERYPKVVLRVQFPDRYVLQGFFRPLETVGAVRQFVRSHLEDPQLSFYLFITPPKTILNDPSVTLFQTECRQLCQNQNVLYSLENEYGGLRDCQNLVDSQADLFPGALVYFGSDVKTDFYLKRELLESSVSAMQADESIASCIRPQSPLTSSTAPEEPMPPLEDTPDPSRSTQDEQDPSANTPAAKPTRSDPGKVPKWLKLPGKK